MDRGVDATDSVIDAMDREIDAMDPGTDPMDRGVDAMDPGTDPMDREVDAMDPTTDPMDRGVDAMDPTTDPMDREIDAMDPTTDPMDREIDAMDPGTDPMDREIDAMDPGTDPMDREIDAMDPGTDPMDREIDAMDRTIMWMDRLLGPLPRGSARSFEKSTGAMSKVPTLTPCPYLYRAERTKLLGDGPRWGGLRILSGQPGLGARKPARKKDPMARLYAPYFHVELDFSTLDDADRHLMVQNMKAAAPTSQVFLNSPSLQTLLGQLVAQDATLTTSNAAVAADRLKLKTDTANETTARGTLDGITRTMVALVETGAKSPADIQQAGLVPLPPRQTSTLPPAVPEQIDMTIPKTGHGKVRVSVHETGGKRGQYVAQSSPDPIGTWSPLGVGLGKTRTVTGASGTKVWVRFAQVRAGAQSDWSTPVLVTLP
jgi:hypothetical protein